MASVRWLSGLGAGKGDSRVDFGPACGNVLIQQHGCAWRGDDDGGMCGIPLLHKEERRMCIHRPLRGPLYLPRPETRVS